MGISIYFWIGFHIFIFLMLALDLGVFHKKIHKVPVKEALSGVWSGYPWHYYLVFASHCLSILSLVSERPKHLNSLPVM